MLRAPNRSGFEAVPGSVYARAAIAATLLVAILSVAGCASFRPAPPAEDAPFIERALTQSAEGVTVSVAVLSGDEAERAFGVPLEARGIQAVWLRMVNRSAFEYLFVPAGVDPDYFSPQEVVWASRSRFSAEGRREMSAYFDEQRARRYLPPGTTNEGFVHTRLDPVVKYVSVQLYRRGGSLEFDFVLDVPGFEADFRRVDFEAVVPTSSDQAVSREALRDVLVALPCCVLGPDGKTPGDPLNIVVIGNSDRVFHPFARRSWDATETISGGSVWRTVLSSLFGSRYRTSPVSALFFNDRAQDIALQKVRTSVDERNHLRLWLTPYKLEGKSVWVGQISRDIGVRLSSKTFVTHKIDPDVDEARDYLLQDLLLSGNLAAFGFVRGVGAATPEAPRYNYTLDPYFTDGLRVVLVVDDRPVPSDRLELIEWEWPPAVVRNRPQ